MIKILMIIITFVPLHSFAQGETMGGQNGSGGNGCYTSTGYWRSLEEVSLPRSIYRDGQVATWWHDSRDELPKKKKVVVFKKDMSQFQSARNAKSFIRDLTGTYPHFTKTLLEFFVFFENAHVVQNKIDGIFDGDATSTDRECVSYHPAFLTKRNGAVIVSRPVWNRMHPISREFIFIHESLRFAQMFHPAFMNFSNQDLQELTKLIMSTDAETKIRKKIAAIEELLKNSTVYFASKDPKSKSEIIFSEKMLSCNDQGIDLKTCSRELQQDDEYLSLILEALI